MITVDDFRQAIAHDAKGNCASAVMRLFARVDPAYAAAYDFLRSEGMHGAGYDTQRAFCKGGEPAWCAGLTPIEQPLLGYALARWAINPAHEAYAAFINTSYWARADNGGVWRIPRKYVFATYKVTPCRPFFSQ